MLIVGGDAKLGKALAAQLEAAGHPVAWTTRRGKTMAYNVRPLDMLLDPKLPWLSPSPRVVFIVAAITSIARCEQDPTAWRINADAPILLAAAARAQGSHAVFVSSDAVEIAPHTAYAMQKAHAEVGVLALGGAVFRPARIDPERMVDAARALMDFGVRAHASRIERWA